MAKQPTPPVRLEDIAARVGVSRSEVSRVLNGRVREGKDVGAATRDRILAAALEMNYRPHRAAQNLARGRTDTVALMMVINAQPLASPFIEAHRELSPHYHEIIGGLTYTLSQFGLNLLLAQCGGPDSDPAEAMVEMARSRSCDGMIITDMRSDDQRPAMLEATGLPFVVRGSSPIPNVVAVGMDNAAVAYDAIAYLHSLGHRRILFFNIGRDLMSGKGRYEGFCKGRDEFGLSDTLEYHDGTQDEHGAFQLMAERLQEPNIPTAVFAHDEIAALGVERAIKEAGLRVPQDISLMTCLNARFMRRIMPHVTVMNVRQNDVAAHAAELMGRMLRGETIERQQTFLSPILEERASTAPPSD